MITNISKSLKILLLVVAIVAVGTLSTPVIWGSTISPFDIDDSDRGIPQDYDDGGDMGGDMGGAISPAAATES